jgi:hypothetical protein
MIAGRDFADTDTATAAPVAIVNETFARKFAFGRNPIGMRVRQPGSGQFGDGADTAEDEGRRRGPTSVAHRSCSGAAGRVASSPAAPKMPDSE